jgi:hypothetical protein
MIKKLCGHKCLAGCLPYRPVAAGYLYRVGSSTPAAIAAVFTFDRMGGFLFLMLLFIPAYHYPSLPLTVSFL